MNRAFFSRLHRLVAGGLLVALVGVAAACDTGEALEDAEPASTDVAALAEDLTQELSLSTETARDLRAVLTTHEGRAGEPGFLWYVARDLQQRLSDEQKDKLLARLDQRGERRPFRRGDRPGFGQGDARRGDGPLSGRFGDRRRAEERREAAKAVMTDVLGLTADQRTALQALKEETRTEMQSLREQVQASTLDRDAVRDAFATLHEARTEAMETILTEEQAEIVKFHHVLTQQQGRRMMRPGLQQRRGGFGPFGGGSGS